MTRMITVRKAKAEIKRLQFYIDLVESYETDTLDKFIIKEYAFSTSIAEVVRVLDRRGIQLDGNPISKEYVIDIIKSKPMNELHRIIRKHYFQITKHSRNSS